MRQRSPGARVDRSGGAKKRDGRDLSRTVTKEFSAAEMAGKTLYCEEERNFSAGDRVVLLKNDTKLDLQNGCALVDLGDRKVEIDLSQVGWNRADFLVAFRAVGGDQGGSFEAGTIGSELEFFPVAEQVARRSLGPDQPAADAL
ncbi:MAG: hypothetical protein FPO08_11875 [Geobacter sp.]|nr:MAG: hypothetical protein FPO08_11875 [Geobacter sp.]